MWRRRRMQWQRSWRQPARRRWLPHHRASRRLPHEMLGRPPGRSTCRAPWPATWLYLSKRWSSRATWTLCQVRRVSLGALCLQLQGLLEGEGCSVAPFHTQQLLALMYPLSLPPARLQPSPKSCSAGAPPRRASSLGCVSAFVSRSFHKGLGPGPWLSRPRWLAAPAWHTAGDVIPTRPA